MSRLQEAIRLIKTFQYTLFLIFISLSICIDQSLAGTFGPVSIVDRSPTTPIGTPTPSSFAPRYISGFGSDNTFTIFFEDRDDGQRIKYLSTTTGPNGFPVAPTSTNIVETHFVVKNWPINIGGNPYQYRAWGSVGNVPEHNFYVSNDLTNWTLVSTFTIPNASGFVGRGFAYYGFYDVVFINGTYYAFSETNGGQTIIVRSANGDDIWEAIASVGGTLPGDGPLQMPESATPRGSFIEFGQDCGYGLIKPRGNNTGFYLAVNTAAKKSLTPAQLEAAFINPANWTWHDGTTGLPSMPILVATSERDLREAWVVPLCQCS